MSAEPRAEPADSSADGESEGASTDQAEKGERPEQTEEAEDRPQDAWAARDELRHHTSTVFGGGFAAGDQTGVSGGNVTGDVILGTKIEYHYRYSFGSRAQTSGEIPKAEIAELAAVFTTDENYFDDLVERLRTERYLVLSGAPFTGRRSAGLMLLRKLNAAPVRALDPTTPPTGLAGALLAEARGYLLSDLETERDRPLRDLDLLAIRNALQDKGAYLVITVGPNATTPGVPTVTWEPPATKDVLRAHLHHLVQDPEREREMLELAPSKEFLAADHHQLREAKRFAEALAEHAAGRQTRDQLHTFATDSVTAQIQEWFAEETTPLRDKAFLISLAVFDEAPYALAAELGDALYSELQRIEERRLHPVVPIFGTSIAKRLKLARAEGYEEEEHTEWGPVRQYKARFRARPTALLLLRVVWTGYPSARPALLAWLRRLAGDGRPLVRARAASAAAVLICADLPSTMALLVEGWARTRRYRVCLVAANALALAQALQAPNIRGIVHSWSQANPKEQRLRWTAIRAIGLLGAETPRIADESLAALIGAAEKGTSDAELQEIAQSAGLLLTAKGPEYEAVRSHVTSVFDRFAQGKGRQREVALRAFMLACSHQTDILAWYGDALVHKPADAARHIVSLWRACLQDPGQTKAAAKALQGWVNAADEAPALEWALSHLLTALHRGGTEDRMRLDYVLRTTRTRPDGPRPEAAERLLAAL